MSTAIITNSNNCDKHSYHFNCNPLLFGVSKFDNNLDSHLLSKKFNCTTKFCQLERLKLTNCKVFFRMEPPIIKIYTTNFEIFFFQIVYIKFCEHWTSFQILFIFKNFFEYFILPKYLICPVYEYFFLSSFNRKYEIIWNRIFHAP